MKLFLPLSLMTALFASSAHAGLITIDYVAKITESWGGSDPVPGINHRVGDVVIGQFVIDLSRAEREYSDVGGARQTYSASNNFDLVKGYFNEPSGRAIDRVALYNGVWPNLEEGGEDYLSISEGFVNNDSPYQSEYTSINLSLSLGEQNWIETNELEGINLAVNSAKALANSNLIIHRWDSVNDWRNPRCPCTVSKASEYLKLQSVSIGSAKVPEPGTLGLFVLGFLSLLAKRLFRIPPRFTINKLV